MYLLQQRTPDDSPFPNGGPIDSVVIQPVNHEHQQVPTQVSVVQERPPIVHPVVEP